MYIIYLYLNLYIFIFIKYIHSYIANDNYIIWDILYKMYYEYDNLYDHYFTVKLNLYLSNLTQNKDINKRSHTLMIEFAREWYTYQIKSIG